MNMPVEQQLQNAPMPAMSTGALVLDPASVASMQVVAKLMAGSKVTVPEHLRNEGDCLAVVMQAMQWGMNPFVVAQKTHIVSGKLGYEAQLVNAVVTASGAIKGHFRYEYQGEGDKLQCRVGAVLRGDTEITWGEWLGVWQVTTKNSPLWKTNPKQQMGYLQLKNWTRVYAPGPILGVYTIDELEEPAEQPQRITPDPRTDIPPGYSDADFTKNFPIWEKAIKAGKKTAADIIATVSTKGTLSAEQRERINALKCDEPQETQPAQQEQQA